MSLPLDKVTGLPSIANHSTFNCGSADDDRRKEVGRPNFLKEIQLVKKAPISNHSTSRTLNYMDTPMIVL